MLIHCIKSTGDLVPPPALVSDQLVPQTYNGQPRPTDTVPARGGFPVRMRFLADDGVTAVLLEAGSTVYFDCKGLGLYDSLKFAVTVAITQAPVDPATGYYEGRAVTNTPTANALLSPNNPDGTKPDATEPDFIDLMAQLCWQGPTPPGGEPPEPSRSRKWRVTLDNSVRHGLEGTPVDTTPGQGAPAKVAADNTFTGTNRFHALLFSGFFGNDPDAIESGAGVRINAQGNGFLSGGAITFDVDGNLAAASLTLPNVPLPYANFPAAGHAGQLRYRSGLFYGSDGATWDPFSRYVAPPANSESPGSEGMWSGDADYFYFLGTDGWRRIDAQAF